MKHFTLSETVFIATLASAFGIAWWAYSFIYALFSPILKTFALSGLLDGFWLMAGPFFGYIIRKKGSALLGETIAATIEGILSQWGFSALLFGICQGLPVELFFFVCRYKRWNKTIMIIAGAMAALGGFIMTYYWYQYSALSFNFNLITLVCELISGGLAGLLAKYLADSLAHAGVLNQFRICHAP